jgi:predicted HTH domain antitoxin
MEFRNPKPISQIREEEQNAPITTIGKEFALLKIDNMQKEAIILTLGQELAAVKIELIQLKGGGA